MSLSTEADKRKFLMALRRLAGTEAVIVLTWEEFEYLLRSQGGTWWWDGKREGQQVGPYRVQGGVLGVMILTEAE